MKVTFCLSLRLSGDPPMDQLIEARFGLTRTLLSPVLIKIRLQVLVLHKPKIRRDEAAAASRPSE